MKLVEDELNLYKIPKKFDSNLAGPYIKKCEGKINEDSESDLQKILLN